MNLLYISGYKFKITDDGVFATPAYGDAFWDKYLDVFDTIDILGEAVSENVDNSSLVRITNPKISVKIIPANTRPEELKNDPKVKRELKRAIKKADAILIKQASRKGNFSIKYADKYHKPYMIELTGDLNIELQISDSILKRLYRPLIYSQVLKAIRNCQFGLYVTQNYLQEVYPIAGRQFGCTDTVLSSFEMSICDNRMDKIMHMSDTIKIGMIATYADKRKGLDTAIEMLHLLNNPNIELHVLGRGSKEQQLMWFDYAKKNNVEKQLFFDPPVPGGNAVLKWIDNIDIIILPSRAEGLPRCILEAMSRACPCITSDVCGLPELVEDKWLHKPSDSKQLALLVEKMISNKSYMREAALYNFNKSKEYDYKKLNSERKAFLEDFRDYAERF